MFTAPERMIAGRYLRPSRDSGFISVIAAFALVGIALGVGTLIVVLAVMSGFRAELLDRILGLAGHVTVQAGPNGIADYDEVRDRILATDGIVAAIPFVEGQVMASANGVAGGAVVRGVRVEDLLARDVIRDGIVQGSLDRLLDGNSVAIGARMAARMGLREGDRITLLSPEGTATAFGTVPRVRAYPIGAVFDVGMFEYDSTLVLMDLATAQVYFDKEDRVSAVDVLVEDPDRVATYRLRLLDAGIPGRLTDWQQANAQFFNALQVERNVMFLILTLIILVAAFNIITGLIMLVRSKARDIAILRTMGATRGAVMRIFFLSGASIGVLGTALGLTLGTAFAANIETIRSWLQGLTGTELFAAEIYFLSHLPARLETADVLSVVGMGLVLSLLATLYPSWRAARVDPVEALRYE
jgi:lipoprotein-releasing system permease protein